MTATAPAVCPRQPLVRPMCLRAAVARRVLESVASRVPADVVMPEGSLRGRGGAYLAYSEAGFASRYLDVAQLRLTRPDEVVA